MKSGSALDRSSAAGLLAHITKTEEARTYMVQYGVVPVLCDILRGPLNTPMAGPASYCEATSWPSFNSTSKDSACVSMTWRAISARPYRVTTKSRA